MELRQLRYVEAVARLGGFTRAAEELHVAQPAVSAQVRRLEAELGVMLLERTTRRVALTAEGEVLVARARRVLAELGHLDTDLAALQAVVTGRVSLGVTEVVGSIDLPASLARFHGRYPGVGLSMRSGLVASLLAGLDDGSLDVVLGPVHADLPDRFVSRKLVDEGLVLVTPPGHGVAEAGGSVDLARFAEEPFVCLPAGSGLRGLLDEAASAAGFVADVPFEASGPGEIRALVAAGLGVALLARSAALRPGPTVDVHEVRAAPRHPPIGLIHHRDRRMSPAGRAWRAHLEEVVAGADAARGGR